ncbi:hypothetical protein MSAN_01409600 [Mycena sanguinolenta]|uniref:Uncharacterized protein n=1 Tax=Mycena sanguinolenta TaxID=230812 RepID=A0A8H6YA30_9AGAR|nr:hypothetical protein MSAN_01409600 [Mycena sanguinolenta]
MDQLVPYQAIFFPADGRPPSVVQLMTRYETILSLSIGSDRRHSPTHYGHNPGPRMPHPEAHMDFIAESSGLGGAKPWKYFIVDSLDMMNKKFTHPYIVYYPTVSRDGMPFPINKSIRDIQGPDFQEKYAWRVSQGNIIIGKFRDHDQPFTSMMDASMADFPILKNFIRTRARQQC